jgi:hypothetical protein
VTLRAVDKDQFNSWKIFNENSAESIIQGRDEEAAKHSHLLGAEFWFPCDGVVGPDCRWALRRR